jgi:hypothetical protein
MSCTEKKITVTAEFEISVRVCKDVHIDKKQRASPYESQIILEKMFHNNGCRYSSSAHFSEDITVTRRIVNARPFYCINKN